jgi:RND family efflux transporter MFP subunit
MAAMAVAPAATAQPAMPASPVRVDAVESMQIAPRMWTAGTVISRDDARIAAEVNGRITRVAEVGDFIEQDQLIAVIDDKRLKLQQQEAISNVKSLTTRIGFLKKELARSNKLATSKLTSQTAVDEVRSNYEIALTDRDAARARLALIDDKLDKTHITAPFNGYVTERLKVPGENVSDGTAVVRLVGLDNLEIEASGPLRYVGFIEKGMNVDVKTYDQQTSATIRSLVSIGANESRQFTMRLDFDQENWLPGMPVRVAIPTDQYRTLKRETGSLRVEVNACGPARR